MIKETKFNRNNSLNNRKTPALKVNGAPLTSRGTLKDLSKIDVSSTKANNLLSCPMDLDSLLPPEELSSAPKQSQDFNEVAEYKHLFDTFGASFVPKELSVRDMVQDFLQSADSEDPFYIIDLSRVVRQMLKWRAYLPRVKPFYAVK